MDDLIVIHRDSDDVAGDLRADRYGSAINKRVVRAFEMLRVKVPKDAQDAGGDENDSDNAHDDGMRPQRGPEAGPGAAFLVVVSIGRLISRLGLLDFLFGALVGVRPLGSGLIRRSFPRRSRIVGVVAFAIILEAPGRLLGDAVVVAWPRGLRVSNV